MVWIAHDLYTVSEDNFRHQILSSEEENYKLVVVTCCLYLCGDDCHGFLKLKLLVNEFYVKRLMNYGRLQVMAAAGDNSLTDFHVSIIVVMVQPLNLFVKQEACYLKVLIIFVIQSFLQILFTDSGLSPDHSLCNSSADSPAVSNSPANSPAVSSPADFPAVSSPAVSNSPADSPAASNSPADSHSSAVSTFPASGNISHFVSYLIQPDRSDFLGCSAEYDNGSISMDKYTFVSGFVEFKTPPDLLLVEDRLLIKASWFSTVIVLGFQGIDILILLTRRLFLHLFTGGVMIALFSMKEDSSLENMIFILLHCSEWLINGFMTPSKDVLQDQSTLHPYSRIRDFEMLQNSSHLLQGYSGEFIEYLIVAYAKWVCSILDLLYCSLPRPPDFIVHYCASVQVSHIQKDASLIEKLWRRHS